MGSFVGFRIQKGLASSLAVGMISIPGDAREGEGEGEGAVLRFEPPPSRNSCRRDLHSFWRFTGRSPPADRRHPDQYQSQYHIYPIIPEVPTITCMNPTKFADRRSLREKMGGEGVFRCHFRYFASRMHARTGFVSLRRRGGHGGT